MKRGAVVKAVCGSLVVREGSAVVEPKDRRGVRVEHAQTGAHKGLTGERGGEVSAIL